MTSESVLPRDLVSVDRVHLCLLCSDLVQNSLWHFLCEFGGSLACRVEHSCTAVLQSLQHHVGELVRPGALGAGNVVSRLDSIWSVNGLRPESHVRNRASTGLLRVIGEVRLDKQVSVVSNQLDGVLVRRHCSVRSHTPEEALAGSGHGHVGLRPDGNTAVGDVIFDSDRERLNGGRLLQVRKHGSRHGRSELL